MTEHLQSGFFSQIKCLFWKWCSIIFTVSFINLTVIPLLTSMAMNETSFDVFEISNLTWQLYVATSVKCELRSRNMILHSVQSQKDNDISSITNLNNKEKQKNIKFPSIYKSWSILSSLFLQIPHTIKHDKCIVIQIKLILHENYLMCQRMNS